MTYDIRDYGAVGDGITNDREAIQEAIDVCSAAGGGRVLVPGGLTFRTGSIELKRFVDLHVETGATLLASDRLEDYAYLVPPDKFVRNESGLPSFLNSEYAGKPLQAFIHGVGQEHVTLSGFGTIDANEVMFYGHDSGYHIEGTYYPRVPLMLVENFTHLTVRDVTMKNCAFWTLHPVGCDDVTIDGVRILNNLRMANSDGIDPDHCRNVRIVNCHIECGDDCIVLKNTAAFNEYGNCENIVISNCTLVSTSAAIKFGTEGERSFRNVLVTNCTISGSNRGISIQIRDGGNVENVVFSNISIETRRFSHEWWGRAEAITLTAIDRKPGVKAGKIRNVRFSNISCEGENGIFIHGSADNAIEEIVFEGVRVHLKRRSKWEIEGYDVRPCPPGSDLSGIVKTKVSPVYMRHAADIVFRGFRSFIDGEMVPYAEEAPLIADCSRVRFLD